MKWLPRIFIVLFILMIPLVGFFSLPRKAHAFLGVGDVGVFMDPLTEIETTLGAVNTYASMIQNYVLEPIAFIASGRGIQQITSGVLQFVNGLANGTGMQQFVQNIRGDMQQIGDIQNTSFLGEFTSHSNSPFTSSIAAALNESYLQGSSLSGFLGSIQNTLLNTVNGSTATLANFLNGDWSAGGASTWFALTTQEQNNPFTLLSLTQNEMGSIMSQAQQAHVLQANWGNGFTSWCGNTSQSSDKQINTTSQAYAQKFQSIAAADGLNSDEAFQIGNTAAYSYVNNISNTSQMKTDIINSAQGMGLSNTLISKVADDIANSISSIPSMGFGSAAGKSVQAGAPCINRDGTPGTVQTPASVIQSTLGNALNQTSQKIAQIGNISGEISQLIGTITNIVKTTSGILGNNNSGGSGGLANASGPTTATANQSNASNSYGGLSAAQVFQDFQNSQASSGMSDLDARTAQVKEYASDWAFLGTEAQNAMQNLQNLVYSCSDEMSRRAGGSKYDGKVANAAGNIRSGALQAVNNLDTVIQQSNQVAKSTQQYLALMQKAKDAQASGDQNNYLSYYSQLQALPPTSKDLTDVITDVQTQGFSYQVFPDSGSFTVNSGSLINQIKYYQLVAWCGALPKNAMSCNDTKGQPPLMRWAASNEYIDPSWTPSSCLGLVAFSDSANDDPNATKPVTITWTTTDAASFSLSQGIGEVAHIPAGSTTTQAISPEVFTGTATDANGNIGYCSAVYNGAPSSVLGLGTSFPACTLSANPTSISNGGSATLSWTSTNAKWFSISQNVGAVTPVAGGSTPVTALTGGLVYTGTAMNAKGQMGLCAVPVNVGNGPTCTMTVAPQ